ncbi:Putative UDP-glucosyltransferase YdhE [Durusdinium trenchii]|uniref:UDP-glucosyltransferase YdhE n=1 Tax=Durusdinium trenchii TaxID=1381693 RepID=A0ABP0MR61_9DINO
MTSGRRVECEPALTRASRHANGSLMAQSSQYRLPETDINFTSFVPGSLHSETFAVAKRHGRWQGTDWHQCSDPQQGWNISFPSHKSSNLVAIATVQDLQVAATAVVWALRNFKEKWHGMFWRQGVVRCSRCSRVSKPARPYQNTPVTQVLRTDDGCSDVQTMFLRDSRNQEATSNKGHRYERSDRTLRTGLLALLLGARSILTTRNKKLLETISY